MKNHQYRRYGNNYYIRECGGVSLRRPRDNIAKGAIGWPVVEKAKNQRKIFRERKTEFIDDTLFRSPLHYDKMITIKVVCEVRVIFQLSKSYVKLIQLKMIKWETSPYGYDERTTVVLFSLCNAFILVVVISFRGGNSLRLRNHGLTEWKITSPVINNNNSLYLIKPVFVIHMLYLRMHAQK